MKRLILLAVMIALVGCASLPSSPMNLNLETTTVENGARVVIPRAQQYDLTSRINGRTYRLMVASPFQTVSGKPYPVLYVLDGNQYFGTAVEALTRQSMLHTTGSGILVGIGYPTDDPQEVFRLRAFDFTLSAPQDPKAVGRFGGADEFIRVLEEEIKPFVQARYNIDYAHQSIWGQSYAGLTALRILFRKPNAFSTYVFSSPSIWWNDREILADEASFISSIGASDLDLKVLITSAADEQYRGSDPTLLAGETMRLVDNATELAERMSAFNPQRIKVTRTIFDGEVHNTVPTASLSRTMRFAFPLNK